MAFNNKLGSIEQQLTSTYIGVLRRQALLKELNIQKGRTIIDIGCGGGHLVKEISLCVGSDGKAIGVDPSEFQINSAKEMCNDLTNVELLRCNANSINVDQVHVTQLLSLTHLNI